MKHSELRQDLVSGDWILIAPSRLRYAGRKARLPKKKIKRKIAPLSKCPFENPLENVSEKIILQFTNHHKSKSIYSPEKKTFQKDWEMLVLQNKFPVVIPQKTVVRHFKKGPYSLAEGGGNHDLLITRDHNNNFPKLSSDQAFHVFEAFRDRYLMFLSDKNIAYVSIFHNWGPLSGASVYHPHYQIIAIPVVPPDVFHSLEGSARYFKVRKKCVHCSMIDFERKEKKRIIVETDKAIAFAPFVSRNPFEVRIFPKRHQPYFENSLNEELRGVTEVLQKTLRLITKNLKDPDYNFFIHTAPIKNKNNHRHYHWHIEVFPKLNTRGGFEFGTGIEVDIYDPDFVAKILKK